MTYIENDFYLAGLEEVQPQRGPTYELLECLSLATDTELALAYDACMAGEDREIFPLYLVTNEMQDRQLTFDELEELIQHHYG